MVIVGVVCEARRLETVHRTVLRAYIVSSIIIIIIITSPRNRGGVIFSLQFVCVSVCVCVCLSVCPAFLVNKIPAERMHRFRRSFR